MYGGNSNMTKIRYLCAFGLLFTFCAIDAAGAGAPTACIDTTPHKEQFVTVAPNVNLQVIDWGGAGETMVLLTGLVTTLACLVNLHSSGTTIST